MPPPGDTASVQLNGKLRLPASYLKLLTPVSQQAERRVSVLTGVSGPIRGSFYAAEIKRSASQNLLQLSCPVVKVSGKPQESNSARTSNSPDLQKQRFGSPPQARNHDSLTCLLKAKGIQSRQ